MESNIITAARQRFAVSDLRMARQHGEIAICQTIKGTLTLVHVDGVYTLKTQGYVIQTLACGKAGVVRPVLAAQYSVAGE